MTRNEFIMIAKCIRNTRMAKHSRAELVTNLLAAISLREVMDAGAFRTMANAELDSYMDSYTHIKAGASDAKV